MRFLWGCSPEEGAARLLADFGVRLAMVTCGPKGCLLQNAGAAVLVGAPRVLPVDTTGAGDIFGGSAVSRLLQLGRAPEALTEDELTAIGRFAATAASLSTQYPGGISAIVPEEDRAAVHGGLSKNRHAFCGTMPSGPLYRQHCAGNGMLFPYTCRDI